MNNPRILIIDDDPNILEVLSANISGSGFDVITCDNGAKALDILESDPEVNTIITDLAMGKMGGEALFQEVNKLYPYIPVVILTAYGSIESAVRLVKEGAFDYLEKPSDNVQLIKLLKAAVKHNSLQREIQFLRQELDNRQMFCGIIGKSRKMIEIFDLIEVVANTDYNILIEGETGTGKELVAKAIHFKSDRKDKLFMAINCAAIPHNLMESELFGHEAGAFTGALTRKPGKFELADKGTVFLDEIGELDKSLQTKMLRVTEEKSFHRIGGNNNIKTDFRLIAATNLDLKMEVQRNRFREDLFYRLNVINIKIPPLRQRGMDVLLLTEFFLKKHAALRKKGTKEISPRALNVLYNYDWPGNVRELENVIKRAVALCRGDVIKKADLPQDLIAAALLSLNEKKKKVSYKEEEKKRIIAALEKAKGNKTSAAKLAGINRRQLYRKIKGYSIDCDRL